MVPVLYAPKETSTISLKKVMFDGQHSDPASAFYIYSCFISLPWSVKHQRDEITGHLIF